MSSELSYPRFISVQVFNCNCADGAGAEYAQARLYCDCFACRKLAGVGISVNSCDVMVRLRRTHKAGQACGIVPYRRCRATGLPETRNTAKTQFALSSGPAQRDGARNQQRSAFAPPLTSNLYRTGAVTSDGYDRIRRTPGGGEIDHLEERAEASKIARTELPDVRADRAVDE